MSDDFWVNEKAVDNLYTEIVPKTATPDFLKILTIQQKSDVLKALGITVDVVTEGKGFIFQWMGLTMRIVEQNEGISLSVDFDESKFNGEENT